MSDNHDLADEANRLLQGTPLFEQLSVEARARLASSATETAVLPGELVLQEGERGEEFFLIASGSVHVVGRGFDGTHLIMARLTQGQVFGEQALLQSGSRVRNASIRAAERCRLLRFPRQALLEAQGADETIGAKLTLRGETQAAERRALLREKLLHDIGLGADYRIDHFDKGDVIFREGDPAGNVYLILNGTARVRRGEGEAASILAELLAGQFFGERAILNNAPRAATVEATSALETATLDGAWFRALLTAQPKLQSIMASLQAMYLLPARGLITLQGGTLGSQPTLTATYHLPGGRRVVSTRIPGMDAFSARILGAPEASKSARFKAPDGSCMREVHVHRDQIVELESEGAWEQLGSAFERLLDGSATSSAELNAFESGGDFQASQGPIHDHAEVVCRCARVTAGDLVSMIAGGCNTLDKVAAKSMASMVCGGCIPVINEFLGQEEFVPAFCDHSETCAPDIRMFRLRLLQGEATPFVPGQHVVVQARIGGHWISRPYTISSTPGTPGSYEIIVKRERQGLLSPWLFELLESRSALRVSRPRGTYCLPADNNTDVVFLASGIGITPALVMARTYAEMPRKWHLHIDHSVSLAEQAICDRELVSLAAHSSGISFNLRVTRRDGRVNVTTLKALIEKYPGANFYLCGSSGYTTGVEDLLKQAGVAPSQIRIELFSPVG